MFWSDAAIACGKANTEKARAIGKQAIAFSRLTVPVLMSATRIIIQEVQIFFTVPIWAHKGSSTLCSAEWAGPNVLRNYVSDDMADAMPRPLDCRGRRAGMQSPTLCPMAGLQSPARQTTDRSHVSNVCGLQTLPMKHPHS